MKTRLIEEAASGLRWNSLALIASTALQVGTLALLAHLVQPSEFGLAAMVNTIVVLLNSFSDFGLSNALIHHQTASREELSSLFWLNMLVGLALFVIMWLSSPLVAAFFQQVELTKIIHCASFTFLALPICQQLQSFLKRDLRFRELALTQIFEFVVYGIASVSLALAGAGAYSLILGLLFRYGSSACVLLIVGRRFDYLPQFYMKVVGVGKYLRFGGYQMGERILLYVSNNFDSLLIGRVLGTSELGSYTVALNLTRFPLRQVNPVLNDVAFPLFSKNQDDTPLIRRSFRRALTMLSFLCFPLLALLFLYAKEIVSLLYGERWMHIVPILRVLCLLSAVQLISNPTGGILLAKGKPEIGFWMNAFAAIGKGGIVFAFVAKGIFALAWGQLAFTALALVPIDYLVRHRLIGFTLRDSLQTVWLPLLGVLVMSVLFIVTSAALPEALSLWQFVLLASAGAISYLAVIRVIDRQLLSDTLMILKPR